MDFLQPLNFCTNEVTHCLEVQDEGFSKSFGILCMNFNSLTASSHGVYYQPRVTSTRLLVYDWKVGMADIELLSRIHNKLCRVMYLKLLCMI